MGTTVFGGTDSGYPNSPTITVTAPSNYITVSVTANVSAPLYFMKILHFTSGTIVASSQTTRRNANVILVLDRSGSMNNSSNSCNALKQDVQNFSDQFIEGRDRLGLVTFSTAAEVDYAPILNFKTTPTLSAKIGSMVCVGATSTEQGLKLGYDQIKAINQPGALNVIVFFTDGGANSVYADFPLKNSADSNSRYDYQNTGNYNNYSASPCVATGTLRGLYTDISKSLNPTGTTAGVIDVALATSYGITGGDGSPSAVSSSGCAMDNDSNAFGWGAMNGRWDVAYIPAQDVDLNLTSGTGYKLPDVYPNGPYTGRIRADSPRAIRYAAMNVADSEAMRIRSDKTYQIVTYTIGLAGNEPIPMDTDFMERLANDSDASNADRTKPVGQFLYATDSASLADAFNAIAGQILRLSR